MLREQEEYQDMRPRDLRNNTMHCAFENKRLSMAQEWTARSVMRGSGIIKTRHFNYF